jgi:hypothetical protein
MTKYTTERMEAWQRALQPASDIAARVEQAHGVVSRMCARKDWRMTIPVQDDDSDIVLSDVLNQVPLLLARIKELESVVGMRQVGIPIGAIPFAAIEMREWFCRFGEDDGLPDRGGSDSCRWLRIGPMTRSSGEPINAELSCYGLPGVGIHIHAWELVLPLEAQP